MNITLSKEEKANALRSIQQFFEEDMEMALGGLQAELVLEYFSKEIAPYAYNQGVADAQHFMAQRVEDLGPSCYEEPLKYRKHP